MFFHIKSSIKLNVTQKDYVMLYLKENQKIQNYIMKNT